MNRLSTKYLLSTLSFCVLSACSSGGGGGFDVDSVATPPKESAKEYRDEAITPPKTVSISELQAPALGYAMKLKARNWHPKSKDIGSMLSAEDWIALNSASTLEALRADVEKTLKGKNKLVDSNDNSTPSHTRGMTYVKSGLYYDSEWRDWSKSKEGIVFNGINGYLFYYGTHPSQSFPTTGVANYKGYWDFMTDTQKDRKYKEFESTGKPSDRRSAVTNDLSIVDKIDEAPEGHQDFGLTSEIQVNFADKTLSGQLYVNKRSIKDNIPAPEKQKRYDLDATIQGNRFVGNAKATEKESAEHPFTSNATNSLEGGFFGDNAAELAGKFLTDDHHVFAVFAAKHTGEALLSEQKFDAKTIHIADVGSVKSADDFKVKSLDTFGNVNELIIDGQRISLLPTETNKTDFAQVKDIVINQKENTMLTCCSNLGYLKFGLYSVKGGLLYDLFLVGERSALDEMAKQQGKAFYKGTWEGTLTNGKTSYSAQATNKSDGDLAEFNVDFTDKTLKGELKRAESLNSVFNIDGKIEGNHFSGTASTNTNGFALNPKSTEGDSRVYIQTKVEGAFYGPNASELGGSFAGNELNNTDNTAVVFGAKRQVEVKK